MFRFSNIMVVALAATSLILGACSKSSTSDGGSGASTWTLDGAISGVGATASFMSVPLTEKQSALYRLSEMTSVKTAEDVSGLATACGDGNYYRVRCLSWSDSSSAAAEGVVSCSNNSGSFSVSGLPLNSDISCFIRRSLSATTGYEAFATIELPASSLDGKSDSLNSSGNMTIAVAVGTTGTVTTTVTSKDNRNNGGTGSGTVNPANINGFYKLTCATGDTAAQVRCKCNLFGGGNESQDTCIANSAANITQGTLSIDLNVYEATATSALDIDSNGTVDIAVGGKIYGVSVWPTTTTCTTSAGCTSVRGAGGEGLVASGNPGSSLSWSNSNATLGVAWASGSVTGVNACGTMGNSACTITFGTVPAVNANLATWATYVNNMVAINQGASPPNNFVCNQGGNAFGTLGVLSNAFCMSNFVSRVMENLKGTNLPQISIEPCKNPSDCATSSNGSLAFNSLMISVGGIRHNQSTGAFQEAELTGIKSRSRFLFEQFKPNSAGGGSFREKYQDRRFLSCKSSGTDDEGGVTSCPSGAKGVECFKESVTAITLVPSSSSEAIMGFNKSGTVKFAVIRGGADEGKTISGSFSAVAKCTAAFKASGGDFFVKANKL